MSTYTPISAVTLSADTATVTFSGIPQTYTDLVLVINGYQTADENVYFQFNSDTGSNYSSTTLNGSGTSATSTRTSSQTSMILGGLFTSSNGNGIYHIQNYSNTTTNKTVLARVNAAGSNVQARVGLWRPASLASGNITSILVGSASTSNFVSGATFSLYGIGSGSPKAFGGDEVTTDGTYWYHTFRSSGVFAPMTALTCDYLVVAGGGGGGQDRGGGGGAGGFRTSIGGTALSLSAGTNNTVTIGAGGVGSTSDSAKGTDGGNSIFASITSSGGGGGGSVLNKNGANGGSGGGGWGASGAGNQGTGGTGNTGGYSSVEGFAGASGANSGNNAGGGGGGASEAGNTDGVGEGGDGTASSISGSSVIYAGGGGGGAASGTAPSGGTGGGGAGALTGNGTAGTANTGGGGGGGGDAGTPKNGGNGGSGIVIVRYAV